MKEKNAYVLSSDSEKKTIYYPYSGWGGKGLGAKKSFPPPPFYQFFSYNFYKRRN